MILTRLRKVQTKAYLYYLKEQPRLDDDGDLVLGCIFARDAPQERISHGARALHGFLQPRLLPDRTCINPPSTKNTLGFLKNKHELTEVLSL